MPGSHEVVGDKYRNKSTLQGHRLLPGRRVIVCHPEGQESLGAMEHWVLSTQCSVTIQFNNYLLFAQN